MTSARLIPATLAYAGGVPYASAYGDVYHSADGGLAQARHVFLGGNGLPARWSGRDRFVILETGFGLGLNFLATWDAWKRDPQRPRTLHYLAIEKHPFAAADLAQLHRQWPELAALAAQLRQAWPPLVPGFHRLLLEQGRLVLTLVFGDVAACLPQVDAAADAFYLDGFAPAKNPDMWAEPVLARLNRVAAPDATLATYTVAGPVRRALSQAGFACDKQPGFGRKRDMLSGRFAPRWPVPARAAGGSRKALVLGAGIAGSAACERLAARGWQVTLVERHPQPAGEASGNLAGIVMPLLARDDNPSSRLTRAAFLFSAQWWRRLGGIGSAFRGAADGVLQLADDALHARQQREAIERLGYPPDYVRWVDPAEVARRTGNAGTHGGWLFPGGAWLNPRSLCDSLLAACGERLQCHFGREAAALQREDGCWRLLDAAGAEIAAAPHLVLACGVHAARFPQTRELPLTAIRGQVTHLPAPGLPETSLALCGEGYLTPALDGLRCVGASYDFDADPLPRADSHAANLQRLRQLLPQVRVPDPPQGFARDRVGFRVATPDRLPLAGALPDPAMPIAGTRLRDVPRLPGLHALLGYGSRGLTWAPLAAELLASQLEGEPLPVENMLVEALDPARFALKAFRRRGDRA